MRDRKISILLFVSFLLLLTSFLILCTWVYNYYKREKVIAKTSTKAVPARSEVTRDSLLKIYTTTIRGLESQLGTTWSKSDSLETMLSLKLDEYYRLKDELATLLKNPASNDDFKSAKLKISELQKRMEALRNTSSDVEQENVRLNKLLAQINKDRKPGTQNVQFIERNGDVIKNKEVPHKTYLAPFSTAEMSLTAVKDDEGEEQDVFSTQRKILGSFALKNSTDLDNSEVLVVVIQPNGKVLQKSAWESGSFQSNDGKKIYSVKMSFGYIRGEAKRFSFSIAIDKFTKGNYTMQVYNNGVMIGRISKMLS